MIFARKVHFLQNTEQFSSREYLTKTGRSLSLWKITTPEACLEWWVHGPAPSSRMVCTRMVCSRALSRSALSQTCLREAASALELARRGHIVVQRLHVVKALHCRPLSLPSKLSPCWAHSHEKDAPAGVAAEETELSRPSHRSMLGCSRWRQRSRA